MVEKWVKDLTEQAFGESSMKMGEDIKHPDGYTVHVVSGQLWGAHGFSNWWSWRRRLNNGKLSKKIYSGYGW